MTWEEIIHHPVMFPFVIEGVTQADLVTNGWLKLERMGDNTVVRYVGETIK